MRLLFYSLIALLACSCSSKIDRAERDVARLKLQLQDFSDLQAEQTTQIAALQSKMRQLYGRLEELQYIQEKEVGGGLASIREDISTLRRRVPPPSLIPPAELQEDELLADRLEPEQSRIFRNALVRLREGNFPQAIPVLNRALNESFGQDWNVNVLFWVGVAYEGINDNKRALSVFNDLVTSHPKHPRAAAALLRQAKIFVKLNDKQTAELTLKKLLAEFPKTRAEAEGRELLKNI